MRPVLPADRLANVHYELRGPLLAEALRLELAGHRVLKLNIGNPAPFGFSPPQTILADVVYNLPSSVGYADAQGVFSARTAVANFYQSEGLTDTGVDDVFVGNGVSEMISMVLQALLNPGDEVLIPAPDYPLWTAATVLSGGVPVHYVCDESAGWAPDVADVEAKFSSRTKALVLINPNNPTGAVYPPAVVKSLVLLAQRHGVVVLADEIYEKILYGDAVHTHAAKFVSDGLCLTFSGLSKAYRVAGFRAGWVVVSGNRAAAESFLDGLVLLSSMRMCANVPAQHAIQTALGGYQSINALTCAGGRLYEQSVVAHRMLSAMPGVSCVPAQGGLYVFPKLDPNVYPIVDDEKFVLTMLRATHVLVSPGSSFNFPTMDHLRIVMLPAVPELSEALDRIGNFLASKR